MYLPPIAKINRTRASYDVKRFSGQIQFFFYFIYRTDIKYNIYVYIHLRIFNQDQSLRSVVNNGLKKPEHVNLTTGPGVVLCINIFSILNYNITYILHKKVGKLMKKIKFKTVQVDREKLLIE